MLRPPARAVESIARVAAACVDAVQSAKRQSLCARTDLGRPRRTLEDRVERRARTPF